MGKPETWGNEEPFAVRTAMRDGIGHGLQLRRPGRARAHGIEPAGDAAHQRPSLAARPDKTHDADSSRLRASCRLPVTGTDRATRLAPPSPRRRLRMPIHFRAVPLVVKRPSFQ